MRLVEMLFLTSLLLGVNSFAISKVEPRALETMRKRFGVTAFDSFPSQAARQKQIKVAVLDQGFGDPKTLRDDLPESVFRLVSEYDKEWVTKNNLGNAAEQAPLDDSDAHGRQMALLTWAMTGLKIESAPQFFLMNANGLPNLARAVQYCVDNNVDIILYAQNWEYGGNFDGRGFINKIVSKATRTGILWVNAAGNYANNVYNSKVVLDDAGNAKIGEGNKGLRVKSRLDRNPVKIVLSWNSNAEDEFLGTDKDLDLFLSDEDGNVVGKSELVQITKKAGVDRQEGQSYVPREMIELPLKTTRTGHYRVKVVDKSKNFTEADRIRITVIAKKAPYFDSTENKMVSSVELLDFQPNHEIMIPADHPEVITVGDLTPASSRGPTQDGRIKPDLLLRYSDAEFTDGEGDAGTSNAAAFFAGILAVTKAYQPELTKAMVMAKVKSISISEVAKPGETQGIEDLGIEEVRKIHPIVLKGITEFTSTINNSQPIVLGGRYRNKGTYVISLNTTPLLLSRTFKHLPAVTANPEHYEIYAARVADLSNGQPAIWVYYRDIARIGATEEAWETVLKEKPELFVRIKMATEKQKPKDDPKVPLWDTPAPTEWVATAVKK